MKILVIKRDKLGDLLLTTPVLAHVRSSLPQAHIHLLANDYNAWVAEGHPAVDRLWVYPRVRHAGRIRLRAALAYPGLAWALRRQHFDWAIVAGGDESPRAIERALAVRAQRVVAYAREPQRYGTRLTDPMWPPQGHEIARMMRELEPLGIAMPARILPPRYALPSSCDAFARQWLRERDLAPGAYIVLGLGARRAKKQPTAQQIARWTTHWHDRWGLATVFMWTPGRSDNALYPGDDEIAAPVLAMGLPHVHPFRGPVDQAVGLIYSARTSVIPDSGLMHFAAASPGGVLGLFADPNESAPAARWAPVGPRARYIEAERAVSELDDALVHQEIAMLATPRPIAPASDAAARDRD
ncbi:MAG TPA: glycosyltransferase family 9 protein [Casimicrobiaceae bacterium]|nr:glycosyltransferase family 9 protein [Casimicrobiaceae bacterium]